METVIKIGTIIEHKSTHRLAKITDAYHPPDNPFVMSITYKYIDTDKGRTIVDSTLERFNQSWTILDTNPQENKPIPV